MLSTAEDWVEGQVQTEAAGERQAATQTPGGEVGGGLGVTGEGWKPRR